MRMDNFLYAYDYAAMQIYLNRSLRFVLNF